jgi:hypothetical protein
MNLVDYAFHVAACERATAVASKPHSAKGDCLVLPDGSGGS